MPPILTTTGLDTPRGAELRDRLRQACRVRTLDWTVLDEKPDAATHVVVDMDGMYGPITWIKLHGQGKHVIGMTASPRTNAEYRLPRDFDEQALLALVDAIAAHATESAHVDAKVPDAGTASGTALPVTPTANAPTPPPSHAWYQSPGSGRFRLQRATAPTLLIDATNGQYFGPDMLKPLAPYFTEPVAAAELHALHDGDWMQAVAAAGPAKPLNRLRWFHALLANQGVWPDADNPSMRYHLPKWAQTEREFPRHFRMATVMMRAPCSLEAIAAAAHTTAAEAADFIAASLHAGHAVRVTAEPATPQADEPGGVAGLFARLRGR